MTPRVRRILFTGPPSVDLAVRDGLNVILADADRSSLLTHAWKDTLAGIDVGLRVRAQVDGSVRELGPADMCDGSLGVPETAVIDRMPFVAVATPGGLLDLAVVEERAGVAAAAVERAAATYNLAQERLRGLELVSERALASVDQASAADDPALNALPPPIDHERLELLRMLPPRLDAEIDHDRARRHPQIAGFTRLHSGEFDAVLGRRLVLLDDVESLGLDGLSMHETIRQQLISLTIDTAIDPYAADLGARWNEYVTRRAASDIGDLGSTARSASDRLSIAEISLERAFEDADRLSSGGSGMSVIDRALFAALDDQSAVAVGRSEAALALKRDLLEGPGPLMDWGDEPTSSAPPDDAPERLIVAQREADRLRAELGDIEARIGAAYDRDLPEFEEAVRHDVITFFGADPGEQTGRALAACRVIPAIPSLLRAEMVSHLDAMERSVIEAQAKVEAGEVARREATARRAQARSEAIRAIATLEAHRRETDAAKNLVEQAEEYRQRCLLEVDNAIAQRNELGPDASVLGVLARELGRLADGVPVIVDDAFADVPEEDRDAALFGLAERAGDRLVIYVTADRDVAGWAADNGVNVGRI